jgi:hypothetical protein
MPATSLGLLLSALLLVLPLGAPSGSIDADPSSEPARSEEVARYLRTGLDRLDLPGLAAVVVEPVDDGRTTTNES